MKILYEISSILDEWNNAAQGRRLLSSSIQQIDNFEPLELQDYGSDNIFGVYLSNDWFSDRTASFSDYTILWN